MSIFSSVASLFRQKSRMSSTSVYRRAGCYFVVTQHSSGGGDPCIVSGPLEVLPVGASNAELGSAVFRGLSRTTHNQAYPANQQEWKKVIAPLLSAANCKSSSAFSKTASSLNVNQTGGTISIHPTVRGAKQAFYPVPERNQHLDAPSAEQLGSLVAAELEYAANRDDA